MYDVKLTVFYAVFTLSMHNEDSILFECTYSLVTEK